MSASLQTDPNIGRELAGALRVEAPLAGPGMYRATRLADGGPVAVQLTLVPRGMNAILRGRLLSRCTALAGRSAALEHPNILKTSPAQVCQEVVYTALEPTALTARTLADLLAEGPVEPSRAARLAQRVCLALAEAHRAGLVHRGLTPTAILVGGDGDLVKVCDFGMARIRSAGAIVQGVSERGGLRRAAYLAPEAHCGEQPDAASDLYAVGVLLHEMLRGVTPFVGTLPSELALAHLNRTPPGLGLKGLSPGVARAWDELVNGRLLAKSPEDRPASALSAAQALASLADRSQRAQRRRAALGVGTGRGSARVGGPGGHPSTGPSVKAVPQVSKPRARDPGELVDRPPGWRTLWASVAAGGALLTVLGVWPLLVGTPDSERGPLAGAAGAAEVGVEQQVWVPPAPEADVLRVRARDTKAR